MESHEGRDREDDAGARGAGRAIALDDVWIGEWYEWECVDEILYAPFTGFLYNSMAKARGGIWFRLRMAGERIRLVWSRDLRRIVETKD
jgi:hypothetical protein